MIRPMILTAAALALMPVAAHADGTLKASYLFQGTLASSIAGAPDLVATDPTGTSGFVTDDVEGTTRLAYHVGGTNAGDQQGGLTFDSTGLLTPNDYSIALTFEFFDRQGGYRRIVDTLNRSSDSGFYVNPSNNLEVFPTSGSDVGFANGVYRNVVLTVASDGTVGAYIDGGQSFTTNSHVVDISSTGLINLFLDNVQGGGQGEWSSADIAAANFYDGVLSADQIHAINQDPTAPPPPPPPPAVPEPASWATMIAGFGLIGGAARRRGRAAIA